MSLLLDALNKADQERKRSSENPNISSNHDAQVSYASNRPGITLKFFLAGIVLVVLLISVYWLGTKNQQPTPAVSAQESKAQTSAASEQNQAQAAEQPSAPARDNLPVAQPLAENINTNEAEDIASLYQHQAKDSLAIPATGARTTANNSETIVDTPASHAKAADTGAAVPAATSPISLSQFANLPDIQDLPNSVLQRIPSLKYSEHNYNNNGGSVVINGVVRHVNDQLSEGLMIDKILEDGMILHFETYSFKMRAMNTWVNM